jgi:hypothetical protein
MAYKAVVSANARAIIKEILDEVAAKKGNFSLAMLAQTLPEVRDRWTLVVSAPWADSLGSRSVISDLSSRLSDKLDRSALSVIDRISVRPTDDPIVQTIIQRFTDLGKDVSVEQGGYHLRNTSISTGVGERWDFGEGFVFVADPNANGKSSTQAKEAHRALR